MNPSQFFGSFKSVWGGAVVAATAGPLGLWALDLQPPWPSSAGRVATLFCTVAILLAYIVSRSLAGGGKRDAGPGSKRARKARWIAIAMLSLGLATAIGYLWAYERFVVTDSIERGGRTEIIRTIVGSELRQGIDAGSATQLDLLRDNLYDPEAVWTSRSIGNARLMLLTSFVLMFFMLTFGAALIAPLEHAAPAPAS